MREGGRGEEGKEEGSKEGRREGGASGMEDRGWRIEDGGIILVYMLILLWS